MAGRIEAYIHSDTTTPNKGGAMVEVCCETDFAAKTDEFIAFAKKVAKWTYASHGVSRGQLASTYWDLIYTVFPEAKAEKEALEQALKESVSIEQVFVLQLSSADLLERKRKGCH